ncbi:hypothetical protein [Argonema galeatum]|uniref:hypothetical protein n=1 Tax=Argonema galeatum TaxID=2942762 RepID=UPI00201298A1|nr:hypothetical protein [Argonema galeatum]MCL1467141.1 hypothetical protein [Argonema galeatum A003/A1]
MKMPLQSTQQHKLRANELHLSHKPITYYLEKAQNDSSYQQNLGKHYLKSEEQQLSDTSKESFDIWIRRLYIDLPIITRYVYGQPYHSSEEMAAKVKKTGVLEISVDFNNPVVLSPATNLFFRAIHDSHHILLNAPFSWEGEIKAVRHFCSLTKNNIFHRILFSEIILQAAAYFALGGQFPNEQKLVLSLPE